MRGEIDLSMGKLGELALVRGGRPPEILMLAKNLVDRRTWLNIMRFLYASTLREG